MHIKFKGDGSAEIIGIPARDLTEDDWNELTAGQRDHALASGLYEVVSLPVFEPRPVEPTATDESDVFGGDKESD